MTNESENKGCCAVKKPEVAAGGCCDTKKSCGCGAGNCGCGKGKCCGKILCKLIIVAIIAALGWFAWQGQTKADAVCAALVVGANKPAVEAPEADMQAQVDALQDTVVENAEQQKTIEGQYIEHLKSTLDAVAQAAGCK